MFLKKDNEKNGSAETLGKTLAQTLGPNELVKTEHREYNIHLCFCIDSRYFRNKTANNHECWTREVLSEVSAEVSAENKQWVYTLTIEV